MINKYSINVCWSEEDESFVATIPEFPLLSAFGDTQSEALAEAETVLEMAIETCQEDGIPLPKPRRVEEYSGQFRVRLPKYLHEELSNTASKQGVSLNTYAVALLTQKHYESSRVGTHITALKDVTETLTTAITDHKYLQQVYTDSNLRDCPLSQFSTGDVPSYDLEKFSVSQQD